MAWWLLARGVDPRRIVIEDRSDTTRANMTESVPILAALGVSSVTLVTERFHMKRSRVLLDMVLRQAGLEHIALRTVRAPNRNLEGAAREAPVPRRDHALQTRAWREVPRLDIHGQVKIPTVVVQGVAAAFARVGKNDLILPSSE